MPTLAEAAIRLDEITARWGGLAMATRAVIASPQQSVAEPGKDRSRSGLQAN